MILKYIWAKLHRPFIAIVAYISYLVLFLWLLDRSLYLGLSFGIMTCLIGALYLFRDEIAKDYGKFRRARAILVASAFMGFIGGLDD